MCGQTFSQNNYIEILGRERKRESEMTSMSSVTHDILTWDLFIVYI